MILVCNLDLTPYPPPPNVVFSIKGSEKNTFLGLGEGGRRAGERVTERG